MRLSNAIYILAIIFSLWLVHKPEAQTTRIIYLATIQGDGTDANPFRATGFGTTANQSCIDLRADSTAATGRMLCAADTLPAGGGINQLASTFGETVSAPRKAAIESALGVTLTASNILDVIAELLTTHARLDGSRWKPLRSGRDGKYKIYLGGQQAAWQQTAGLPFRDNGLFADIAIPAATTATLVASAITRVPARVLAGAVTIALLIWPPSVEVAHATSIAEDWNCADNASLTCDLTWTEFTGTEWAIASNQAVVTGLTGVQQKEARNCPLRADRQESEQCDAHVLFLRGISCEQRFHGYGNQKARRWFTHYHRHRHNRPVGERCYPSLCRWVQCKWIRQWGPAGRAND
jgi:hypothetical protein